MSVKEYIVAIEDKNFDRYSQIFKSFSKRYQGFYQMMDLGSIRFPEERVKEIKADEDLKDFYLKYFADDLEWLDSESRYIIFSQMDQPELDIAFIFALYHREAWECCNWSDEELATLASIAKNTIVRRTEDFVSYSNLDNWEEEYDFKAIE